MVERLIAYVDGFNLYYGLHDLAGTRLLWLDLGKLAEDLRPRSDVVCVRYFTAPVLNQPKAASRQQEYQDALVAVHGDRIAITHGRYQAKTRTCRACGATWTAHEEKETDVNIAVSRQTRSSQTFRRCRVPTAALLGRTEEPDASVISHWPEQDQRCAAPTRDCGACADLPPPRKMDTGGLAARIPH